ncbi:glutamate racemase [Candidatus Symbiobacter mobilis]|uniref:Glutamate racemase n=1 Tax=Candidatus Symbiobacter mobilis CR TaxID=946483 RepID=U5N4Q0_9BURK|nr:glutamate racemase [Candidatus Symbiobacter mobilis]AGX86461.1 glutamate racemase [Candidatus Symbiobacter mobilis CR]
MIVDAQPDADGCIGVFDSGIGGLSILRELRAALPHDSFVYVADNAHAPYGERDAAFVVARSRTITAQLAHAGLRALVVACNTATAAAIHVLRSEYPSLLIVGVEPALKPAVMLSRSRRIGVLATRGTLQSPKFCALSTSLADCAHFVYQPCDGLAAAIEADDQPQIKSLCTRYLGALAPFGVAGIDTIVLGCTHYPFALDTMQRIAGTEVRFLDTGIPVARHTARLLPPRSPVMTAPTLRLMASGNPHAVRNAAQRWLGIDAPVLPLQA